VQWIPAILQIPAEAGAEVSGLPLARLVELVVPSAAGASVAERALPMLAGPSPWAPSVFIGAPLLALAAVRTPERRTLGVIGGLALAALAWGRGGSWPAWLGAPELHVAALGLVLAVAAADGFDALVTGQRRAVLALAAGGGLTALALTAFAALRAQQPDLAPAIDRALFDGTVGVACMVGGALLAWRMPGRRIELLFALLVAPSVGAAHSIAPMTERAVVVDPPAWAQAAEHVPPPVRAFRPRYLQDLSGDVSERKRPAPAPALAPAPYGAPPLSDSMATFAGSSAWRWGIAAARSEDPARLAIHDAVWLAAAHEGGALLDRYGISLAILPSTVVGPRKMSALGRRAGWSLVELPVAPAASVMQGWRWSTDPDNALRLLFPTAGGTSLLRGTIVLDGSGPEGPSGREPRPCAVRGWRDGELDLACVSDAAGYAVVSSTTAPGWSVTVDGEAADWRTADVLRRAVAIPAGSHRVRWRYAAPGLATGALVALAGALALVALAGVSWRRRRRARVAPGAAS
jgi:hypothetical protein